METPQLPDYCPQCDERQIEGMVCGGEYPFFKRHLGGEPMPNAWFGVKLLDGRPTMQVYGEVAELVLDNDDWTEMIYHAAGGCLTEPHCLSCRSVLVRKEQ